MILVAGNVGTRLLGYKNRLVSERLARLRNDQEPPWQSDAMFVWDANCSLPEIRSAESEARQILERNRVLLLALTEALIAKRKLGKDEIRAIIARCR